MLTIDGGKRPTYDSGIDYNGERLYLLPAAKRDFEKIQSLGADMSSGNTVERVYTLAEMILNLNTIGAQVSAEDVAALDIISVKTLIQGYTAFLGGLKKDPNS